MDSALNPTLDTRIDELFRRERREREPFGRIARRLALPLLVTVGLFSLLVGFDAPSLPWQLGIVAKAAVVAAFLWVATAGVALSRFSAGTLAAASMVFAAIAYQLKIEGLQMYATFPAAAAAILVGYLAARSVLRITWMIPLAVSVSLSDVQSVYFGTTKALLESEGVDLDAAGTAQPELAIQPATTIFDFIMLHLPSLEGLWVLGSIDVIFAALLIGISLYFHLPIWRTTGALVVAIALALVPQQGVPVLPFFCVAFLVAHARQLMVTARYSLQRMLFPLGH